MKPIIKDLELTRLRKLEKLDQLFLYDDRYRRLNDKSRTVYEWLHYELDSINKI